MFRFNSKPSLVWTKILQANTRTLDNQLYTYANLINTIQDRHIAIIFLSER